MIFREVVRYLLVGGLNTVATYALYLLLMRRIDYRAAYVLAFLAGIVLSAVLLRHVVFRRPGRRYANLYVAANYGLQLRASLAGTGGGHRSVRAVGVFAAAVGVYPLWQELTSGWLRRGCGARA